MMRHISLLIALLFLLALVTCETFDHTPPTVSIDSPNPLAPVMDITSVEITATDDEEMAYVELLVDGASTGLMDSTLPYLIQLSTYDYENGTDIILSVRAVDASDNYAISEPVQVKIVNDDYYPTALDVIKITYENDGFTLLWDESGDEDFQSYQLIKYTGSLLDSAQVAFETEDLTAHSFIDTMIDPLIQYYYRITVTDTFGLSTTGRHNLSPDPSLYAPSGLFSETSDNTIRIRWNDNCPFEDGFYVERDEGTGFMVIDSVAANITGYEDDSLTYDTYYRYRIAGYTATNMTEYSPFVGISSPLEFAPTNLSATASDTTIELTWKDNALFEDGFRVERSEGAGYVQIAEVSANTTTFVDFNLDEDKYYTYRVAAYAGTAQSNYTFSVTLRSPLSFAPSSLTANTTETSIQLRWNDNCIFEDGFIVERDEGFGFSEIAQLDANTAGFTDTALVFDVTYRYQVAAYTADRQSAFSPSISVHSPLLYRPTNLSAEGTDTSIVLKWEDNCIFEEGFYVERRMDAGYVRIAELPADSISFEDTDLIEDEFYSYRVAAFTSTSQSDYSATTSISSPIQFAPSGLSASTIGNTIVLRWNDNCLFEDGFIVERDDGSGFETVAQLGYNFTTFTDDSLEYDKLYNYRVAAFTSTQQSRFSAVVTVTSPITFAPTALAATPLATGINLTWSDNSDFEEGYIIERDDGAGFTEIARVRYNYSSYLDDSLAFGALYSYRVQAYFSDQLSDYTNIVTLESPLELTPSNLVATVNGVSVTLDWDDNSIIEDGFRIERDSGSGFVQIADIGSDTTTYTDDYLNYGVQYLYRVAAYVGSEQSDYTDPVTATIEDVTDVEWVTVAGGDYKFGESDTDQSDLPTDYDIMKYEVTNAQFVAFLEEALATFAVTIDVDSIQGPFAGDGTWGVGTYLYYNFTHEGARIQWNESNFVIDEGFENHPVVSVTWFGANAFAEHNGWRLPTAKEWEKAARSDSVQDYPWGDNPPTCGLANAAGCNDGTLAVGQTNGVSPFGAFDLVGNVWEWINTYDGATANRTIRGGTWSSTGTDLKIWNDEPASPKFSYYTIGFRCVR